MSILSKALQEINSRYQESPSEIILDNKIHRFGKKDHAWYVGQEWQYQGNYYQVVNYGSWKQADNYSVKSWGDDEEKSKAFKLSYKKHTQEAKVELDLEKQKNAKLCRIKWEPIFGASSPEKVHEYLKFKGIKNGHPSRIDQNGVLLIPVYTINHFSGVQRIYKNPESGNFDKRFAFGIEIKGSFCPLKPFRNSEYAFITEGFATAASIQEAFPDIPVIAAFSAGNISPAISAIREISPNLRFIIAADKDANNVGEKSARKAANQFPNVIYKVPKFCTDNPNWTDYNDLHQYESIDKLKEQLQFTEDDFTTITPLGYLENEYFYTSNSNNQIIRFSASGHQKLNFLSLAGIEFWKRNYGIETDLGPIVPWENVASKLMESCRKQGLFNPEKVRGRGVWREKNKFIINDGIKLYPEQKETSYHYQKLIKADFNLEAPFNDQEMRHLLELFQNLSYKKKSDHIYLASWLIQAQIFSVMPWRFHVWLTGSKGSGKSTLMKWIHAMTPAAVLTNNTSAAGIRQEIRNDAFPTIVDESEPDSDRTAQIVELARQMSSSGDFKSLRGTVSGKGVSFNTTTVFLFGSIQTSIVSSADKSRIFVADLESTKGQSTDIFEAIEERAEHFASNKSRLFSRTFDLIPVILESQKVIMNYLKKTNMEARLADQYSALLSCYWTYYSSEVISVNAICHMIKEFEILGSEFMEDNSGTDAGDCMASIMELQIDRDGKTVREAIDSISASNVELNETERMLGLYGIKYIRNESRIFIASNSEAMKGKLTRYPDYSKLLKRDKNIFLENSTQRVRSVGVKKGIFVSIK